MDFIDIHSHILPQLDDGARNLEQTISMLKIAYSEGIRRMIATVHYREGRQMHSRQTLEKTLDMVKDKIRDSLPQMELYLGEEIYYSHQCVELLNQKEIFGLAGSRYVLIEFSPGVDFTYMKSGLARLIYEGYMPILAHVERYECLHKATDFVMDLVDMGTYLQANSKSITGESGRAYKKLTKQLFKYSLIHFIATDTHNDNSRQPKMLKSYEYVCKNYGEEYANRLYMSNPHKIITNQYID